jgi:hypothetical protein
MKVWEQQQKEEALAGRMYLMMLSFILAMIFGNFGIIIGGLVLALVDETVYNATHRTE